ncbi:peptide chain release factor 1 [Sediminitomix flava]|uniref:Peptide chain release factor 1 n=1 Tax=Sediminitomix flava TaxID=379075 RepID=A0A315Z8L8_SEDFL|nr:peptide chain release factor 1 [Sediminitomix flava]PWJ40905.1 peptide chain release factor 1 (bRF-1) [Sediminitomix flava]
MLDKLEKIKTRFIEVSDLIVQPDIISDMKQYAKLNKEYKDLEQIVGKYEEYKNILDNIASSKEVLAEEKDPEFREMAKMELDELNDQVPGIEDELKVMLIPKDPNDSKDSIVEIRAGAGGDEAAIFAGDLYRMYQRYCERMGWKSSLMDYTEGTSGGYKEIVFSMSGEDVYGQMKFESGVHRVQRVPATETQGRIHTSVASVAVLPEMEDVDVDIAPADLKKETYCASGPGGQSVNTTYSAVRLTHIPTGVVAQCQDQKSQLKNYDQALKVLRSRIYEIELKKHQEEVGAQRKSMVGSGDRSDKIRTYNYPQGRVTDHRINKTVYNLPSIVDGEIGEFIEELRIAENAERLKDGGEA